MEMKKQFCCLSCGKKAFVLTLDAFLAVVLVMLLLIVATYYMTITEDKIPQLQMTRTGSDILAVLDYSGVLASLDEDLIEEEIDSLLPSYYGMKLTINGTFGDDIAIGSIDEGKFIAAGERFFLVEGGYAKARYHIWLK